ncbi:MAG: serine/threonine-protein kinase [Xenococcaceae cyanobacterium MO_207.B15]|nr:serine/threonine-protein kinase [Xenococcaceae cyanobacterium MO_207.B15]MDJ0744641.1 serine/threonine-protein kinase [Xenococcaceae cyanobacterium MO_167.B27]
MIPSTRVAGVLNPGISLADGKYQITKLLGQGGFGITYQCLDTKLNRPVALKEFFPEGCWREGTTVVSAGRWNSSNYTDAKQKFLQEGQNLGKFNHPGIVKVFYYFEENNTAYLVMEYLRGKTLGKLLKLRGGKLIPKEALSYIWKVAQALGTLHQAKFLHRDIKPDNIMMAEDGRIVLIDFGAARNIQNQSSDQFTSMLTPGYAPLEQYGQGLPYGDFTDIYALGATLYHLLTGKVPTSAVERAAGVRLLSIREVDPKISPHINEAVMKAMAMNTSNRVQSVREFMNLLKLDNSRLSKKTKTHKFYQAFSDPWGAFDRTRGKSGVNYESSTQDWF